MGNEFQGAIWAMSFSRVIWPYTPKNEIAPPLVTVPYELLARTLIWPFFLVIFSPRPYSLLLELSHMGVSFARHMAMVDMA